MRQIMVMIGFGVFAIPATAAVNFTASDAGSGKLQIAYTTTDGDLPRGVALRVSLSDGARVDFAAPVVVEPKFNTFIDWAYSNPLNYQVGNGNPLALPTAAGALTGDASDFSICMGVLDQAGGQAAGPASATLITLQLKGGTTGHTAVTISGDVFRGLSSGVAGGEFLSNLPITTEINFTPCECQCLKYSAPFYNDWVAWGKPVCWCHERQCRGDVDGKSFLGKPVVIADLNIFKAAFNKTNEVLKMVPNGICADLNHAAFLGKRVTLADLNEFKKYFNLPLSQVPSCDLINFNFWITP